MATCASHDAAGPFEGLRLRMPSSPGLDANVLAGYTFSESGELELFTTAAADPGGRLVRVMRTLPPPNDVATLDGPRFFESGYGFMCTAAARDEVGRLFGAVAILVESASDAIGADELDNVATEVDIIASI